MNELLRLDTPAGLAAAIIISALVIVAAGTRLSGVADRIADRTGLGEAMVGAVLLGAATSLPGLIVSVTAAANGYASLAVANSLGGIAAQTFFLVVADATYRRANLEHAAASIENLIQSTVLMGCLALLVMAASAPSLSLFSIHPISIGIFALYLFGLNVTRRARQLPGWKPRRTSETEFDEPNGENTRSSLSLLFASFTVLALVTGAAGFVVGRAAESATSIYGLEESVAGAFLAAIVTSLPELVTTIAAVRRGALTLAVGGIIGGNAFDVLFISAADIAYREGPIYAAISRDQLFQTGLALTMTAVLLMGLLRREKHGPARLGFETVLIGLLYLAGSAVLFL
ncbi:sodium:calcium antiporter [Parvularcula maris]|uniref:Sodium:calcium antiporter n=1 Tax=Parvularcula maris TaxID=2965077 RepID=A0A9X2L7G8_9PROT|nr:sodium:calcium antiporter [Parvularcula maris]MCQ8184506.1 sodium:calcium antiporter [Parvularcula maris]